MLGHLVTGISSIRPSLIIPGNSFAMACSGGAFVPKVYAIEIDYSRIDTLLEEAIKIWDSKTPPEGRSGCKDCGSLEGLFAIQTDVENTLTVRDKKAWSMSSNDSVMQRRLMRQLQDRKQRRWSALRDLEEDNESLSLSDSGIAGNWEFFQ